MANYDKLIAFLESETPNAEEVKNFKQAYRTYSKTGEWDPDYTIFTSGWLNLEGAMLMTPENTLDADYKVFLTAKTERSLRDLLLAFPRRSIGIFSLTESWMQTRIHDILECDLVQTENGSFFRGIKRGCHEKPEHRTVSKRKDTIASHMRKLSSLKGKIEHSQFVVEGQMMVERALMDGLPIESILYTNDFVSSLDGKNLLKQASQENLSSYFVSDGVMGSVTTTRPVPSIVAAVHFNYRPFLTESGKLNFHYSSTCTLLITENIANPDNLGMTLRTADAAGVSAVLLSGEGANPFHKNCIRASRGAVGRLPLFHVPYTNSALEILETSGWKVVGTTSSAKTDIYDTEFSLPSAIIVGNENIGLSQETRKRCSELVRIPMAAGQSSLNVGVAAGILLYEITRQKMTKL